MKFEYFIALVAALGFAGLFNTYVLYPRRLKRLCEKYLELSAKGKKPLLVRGTFRPYLYVKGDGTLPEHGALEFSHIISHKQKSIPVYYMNWDRILVDD